LAGNRIPVIYWIRRGALVIILLVEACFALVSFPVGRIMMLRIIVAIGLVSSVLFAPLSQVRAEEKVFTGLTEKEFDKLFDDNSKKGWHPVAFKVSDENGKKQRYDSTWETKGNPGWYLYYGMNAEEFAKKKKNLGNKGFTITSESAWKVGDEPRFGAIWLKK
jgi:Bacterial tandem repeat domain 1